MYLQQLPNLINHLTPQLPVNKWYDIIGEKTIADAILDRLIHQAHGIELKGESMRKNRKKKMKFFNYFRIKLSHE